MDAKRRDFLKIAGISTLAGLGGGTVITQLVSGTNNPVQAATDNALDSIEQKASGKRYGMIIDMQKFFDDPCLGEKVVKACHAAHNVPEFPEKRDEIKWIWMTQFENAFPETANLYRDDESATKQLPILCNHCDNPPCVRVCPTQATFKDKDGIVIMDYHRCIGCRFCMAACPYGSRSFNWRDPVPFIKNMDPDYPHRTRGVVEKCNFCAERVGVGRPPACVEACGGNGAIVFGDLNDAESEIRKILKQKRTMQRNPSLGTLPSVFYIV